ncbi:MAG: hypothetical protein Q8P90_00315 [bacterium]|nr:hypothetical protein [bacterium]
MNKYFIKKNILIAVGLITFGIGGRMLLLNYPNIETLMVVAIISGAMLGPYLGFSVALFSVIGSDILIGNSEILIYTWTAWAIIGIVSTLAKQRKHKVAVWADTLKFTGFGIAGTLFFYILTNFGVWHLSGMYPHTFVGLIESYVMAVPFLRNQLLGNMVIVPSVSLVFLTAWKYLPVFVHQTKTVSSKEAVSKFI